MSIFISLWPVFISQSCTWEITQKQSAKWCRLLYFPPPPYTIVIACIHGYIYIHTCICTCISIFICVCWCSGAAMGRGRVMWDSDRHVARAAGPREHFPHAHDHGEHPTRACINMWIRQSRVQILFSQCRDYYFVRERDEVVMSIDKGDEVVMSIDKGDEDVLIWDAFVRHEWKCSADNNNTLIGHTGTKAVPVVRK